MTRPPRLARRRGETPPRVLRHLAIALVAAAAAFGLMFVPATAAAQGTNGHEPPTGGSLGPNVLVFTPSMAQADIQTTLDNIATQQVPNQFGTQRYAILFAPGTYGSAANPSFARAHVSAITSDTDGCDMPSCAAAFAMLPCCTTVKNKCRSRSVRRRPI